MIEGIVKEKRVSYMDAVVDYCEKNDIDLTTVNPMINKSLKEKIKSEAVNLKMLKEKKGGILPVSICMEDLMFLKFTWQLNYISLLIMTSLNMVVKSIVNLIHLLKETIDIFFINLAQNIIKMKY